jgi:hypothetical protein
MELVWRHDIGMDRARYVAEWAADLNSAKSWVRQDTYDSINSVLHGMQRALTEIVAMRELLESE